MAKLEVRRIYKRFGPVEVIHGIDLTIDDGSLTVVVGPSGCGKSTLLRMIAGLEEVSDGEVHIDGKRCDHLLPSARGMAMVFQSYALYPHMSVYENMRFGLTCQKTPKAEIEPRIRRAAEILQITHLLDRRPSQLSGGQSQRVAIGRAIVKEPKAFLFDEPLSNLDAELRVKMRSEIASLHRRLEATMIYVTHDQVEAMTMADKIVVLRDGVVEQIGTPIELYARPRNRFVAGFLGAPQMNMLEAKIEAVTGEGARLAIDRGRGTIVAAVAGEAAMIGQTCTVGIRPEHLERSGAGPIRVGLVASEFLGAETILFGALESGESVTASFRGIHHFTDDTHLHYAVDPRFVHVFDGTGRALAPLHR
jgi:ABC-type sugar transport system ATPase subunit